MIAQSVSYIWRAPQYLILHLSRFEYVTTDQLQGIEFNFDSRKRKVDVKVDFPVVGLDLGEYMHPDAKKEGESYLYDLIAVCNHDGNVDSGHYVASCRDENEGKPRWFSYNDMDVEEMEESEIVSENAYMLIYQRKGEKTMSSLDVIKMISEMDKKEKE